MKRIENCVLAVLVVSGLMIGCSSDLKEPLPSSPEAIGVHAEGWGGTGTSNFHAEYARTLNGDYSYCLRCHGTGNLTGTAGSCNASGCHGAEYHPPGWTTPDSPVFHGATLKGRGFDFTQCTSCHEKDFSGGLLSNDASCNGSGCHVQADGGPLACYTCHGDPVTKRPNPPESLEGAVSPSDPKVGAHVKHLYEMKKTVNLSCQTCHHVPQTYDDPLHVDSATPMQAEVRLRGLVDTVTVGTQGKPVYNAATNTCENVYCHGNFTNGNHLNPTWNGGDDYEKCGSCHGDAAAGNPLPGGTHVKLETCEVCHAETVEIDPDNPDKRRIKDPTKHVNGLLEVFGQVRTDW
ncbi:MAG: CxxxxCH/CxxCH domain-containing protein [Chlorobi bacterium]|nr:CxxxxCH/CxxCH domain-containing protein [Chlorobiota bacterium]